MDLQMSSQGFIRQDQMRITDSRLFQPGTTVLFTQRSILFQEKEKEREKRR